MANPSRRLSLETVTRTLVDLANTLAEVQAGQARMSRLESLVKDSRGASQNLRLYIEGELGEMGRKLEVYGSHLSSYAANFMEARVNTAVDALNNTYNLGASGYKQLIMKLKDAPELASAIFHKYLPAATMVQQFMESTAGDVKNALGRLAQSLLPQGPARRAPRRAPA